MEIIGTQLLSCNDLFKSKILFRENKMENKKLIIGLGTGRCGTMSLANLLNFQIDAHISHEMGGKPMLPWKKKIPDFDHFMRVILGRKETYVGDIAFYLLPYWKELLKLNIETYFVVMKRDKEETVASYMTKTLRENPFMLHEGKEWNHYDWDKCYPKFDRQSKQQAVAAYYDFYYEKCLTLPQNKCFWLATNELNEPSKVLEMLNFCRFDTPKIAHFCKNQS